MKQIGIAVTDPQDWTALALGEAVEKAGAEPFVFRLHDVSTNILERNTLFAGGTDLCSLDAVIVRDVGGGGSEDMSYRLDVLFNLQRSGVAVVNPPEAIRTAANKHMCSYLFSEHGLPTPKTVVTSDLDAALDTVREWGRAVVKPIFGFKGIDVRCVVDDEPSARLLRTILEGRGVLYLQQFIPNPGRDIRVFVVGEDVPAAIYRLAPPGSWINNLSRGGSHEICEVTAGITGLAVEAARAVGAVYAGVDLIEDGDGYRILEVNGTPSGRGIYEACGVDVAQVIVNCVLDRV